MDMILANENDIYIFFEVIRQLEPKSILDVGMFLKRIGSVSRKVMDGEIEDNIMLNGVDFFPEIQFPVWNTIYDTYVTYEEFGEAKVEKYYDLVVALGWKQLQNKIAGQNLLTEVMKAARFVLVDSGAKREIAHMYNLKVIDLAVDKEIYYLLDIGED